MTPLRKKIKEQRCETADPLLCSSCEFFTKIEQSVGDNEYLSIAQLAIILLSTTCWPSSHQCRVFFCNRTNLFCRACRAEHLPAIHLLCRLRNRSSGPCTLLSLRQNDSDRSPRSRPPKHPAYLSATTYNGVVIHNDGMDASFLGTALLRKCTESQFAVTPRPRPTDCCQFLIRSKMVVAVYIATTCHHHPCNTRDC